MLSKLNGVGCACSDALLSLVILLAPCVVPSQTLRMLQQNKVLSAWHCPYMPTGLCLFTTCPQHAVLRWAAICCAGLYYAALCCAAVRHAVLRHAVLHEQLVFVTS